jgi:molybdenum cofactor biosynthesis protein MoaC
MSLSHFNKKNKNIEMVDITKKNKTQRIAEAKSTIKVDRDLYEILFNDNLLFNNLCNTAKIAGIFAAKNTSNQIPLTHHIPLDYVSISFKLMEKEKIVLKSTIKSKYATGLEIEALNCVSTASITIFDMLKSYKKKIIIEQVEIIKKRGGKNNIG